MAAINRFVLIYGAAHALTIAAIKMRGFRIDDGLGHRQTVFQAMEHAVPATERDMPVFALAHKDRNHSEYEGKPVMLPESRLEALTKATENLCEEVEHLFKQWKKDPKQVALPNSSP